MTSGIDNWGILASTNMLIVSTPQAMSGVLEVLIPEVPEMKLLPEVPDIYVVPTKKDSVIPNRITVYKGN